MATCEDCITEEEICEALKKVRKDKTLGINVLHYKVYLRLLPLFVSMLKVLFNHWMEQGAIPQCFNRCVVKLLCKNKHGGDCIGNFWSLMILNNFGQGSGEQFAGCVQLSCIP